MKYKRVELTNFRNYKERAFDFHDKVNIFVGENGKGKTNLLESLYLTAYGKSFRTTKDKELILFGQDFCRVKGTFKRDVLGEEDHEIEVSIARDGNRKGNMDGISFHKYSDIFDHVLAVVFSPEDLKIIKDSPEKRREFMDRELGSLRLSYYRNALMYSRVLAQRNAYLKESNRDKDMLAVWDDNLVHYGSAMICQRYFFIQKLGKICNDIHRDLTGGKETIRLQYDANVGSRSILEFEQEISNAKLETNDSSKNIEEPIINERNREQILTEKIKEEFSSAFSDSMETDFRLFYTTRGPQKDDIDVFISKNELDDTKENNENTEISVRQFGSQGQQRTAALSIKLSVIEFIKEEKGEYPILLLDDVLSELDMSRQQFLLNSLEDVQLFITTTDIPEELQEKLPEGKVIAIS